MNNASRPLRALAMAGIVLISFAVNAGEIIPGQVIVKYRSGVARMRAEMNELYNRVGVERVRYYTGVMKDLEQLHLEEGVTVEDAIERLEDSPLVEYAQPNYMVTIPESPAQFEPPSIDEPSIPLPCIPGFEIPGCDPDLCWIPGLPMPPGCKDWGGIPGDPGNPGNPPAKRPALEPAPPAVEPPVEDPELDKVWGISKVKANEAWQSQKGSKEIIVAVIDTGIDYNHEDLAFNIWRNPNPTQDDVVGFDFVHNDGLPYDDQGHGTHTAGTVGAVGGNGKAISGVSQNVSLMALKFLTSTGSGTIADAIRAINYGVEHGAKVLSNSWGGRGIVDRALYDAIENARKADVLFVAAAGNESANNDIESGASYPAAFDNDNIVAVAATDDKDAIANFSNYGVKSTDLAAPGVKVYSSVPGNKYAAHSGTSMACPHVAGAAALIWSKNPSMTYKQVKDTLLNSVDKVPGLESKTVTGGRLNVMNALRSMD